MTVLVDSSVWFDYFRGRDTAPANLLDGLLGVDQIAIGDLMLVEVLQGFARDADFQRARRLLDSLECVSMCGRELAVEAARNHRRLRAHGVTVRKTIDTIIATRCIVDDLPLLYADRDFDPFVRHLGLRPALETG